MADWFDVNVRLLVRATDEDAAIDVALKALREGYAGGEVYPVGTFSARPSVDPVRHQLPQEDKG